MKKASKEKIVKTLKTNVKLFNRWRKMFKVESVCLIYADLTGADLRSADLRSAIIYGADLYGANLIDANLSYADLSGANLSGANLRRANLRGADLRGAILRGANLSNIKTDSTTMFFKLQCPETGEFIGYKKCKNNVIIKLRIPAEAKRSSATSKKCRAEFVEVLEVIGGEVGISFHDGKTTYKVGARVVCDTWCEDRWIECAGGIHFFMDRVEAAQY